MMRAHSGEGLRRPRLRPYLASALAALLLLILAPPFAHAKSVLLEFSTDGTTWTRTPPRTLFEGDVLLIPGGSDSASLHMRSIAPAPGILTVAITDVRASDEEAARTFSISTRTDAGNDGADVGLDRTRVAHLAESTPVGLPLTLAPGQTAHYVLTIALEPQAGGTAAQNSTVGMNLAISFADAAASPGDAPTPPAVVPVVPSAELPTAGSGTGAGTGGPATTAVPPGETSTEAPRDPVSLRGALAVTGVAGSTIIIAALMTMLGVILLFISRRRTEKR